MHVNINIAEKKPFIKLICLPVRQVDTQVAVNSKLETTITLYTYIVFSKD